MRRWPGGRTPAGPAGSHRAPPARWPRAPSEEGPKLQPQIPAAKACGRRLRLEVFVKEIPGRNTEQGPGTVLAEPRRGLRGSGGAAAGSFPAPAPRRFSFSADEKPHFQSRQVVSLRQHSSAGHEETHAHEATLGDPEPLRTSLGRAIGSSPVTNWYEM